MADLSCNKNITTHNSFNLLLFNQKTPQGARNKTANIQNDMNLLYIFNFVIISPSMATNRALAHI